MLATSQDSAKVWAYTIVDYYGGFVVAVRISFRVYRPEAFERRLVDGPELRGRRLGRVAP
jgi:hypothetical protein